jgi:hypothetical protein
MRVQLWANVFGGPLLREQGACKNERKNQQKSKH